MRCPDCAGVSIGRFRVVADSDDTHFEQITCRVTGRKIVPALDIPLRRRTPARRWAMSMSSASANVSRGSVAAKRSSPLKWRIAKKSIADVDVTAPAAQYLLGELSPATVGKQLAAARAAEAATMAAAKQVALLAIEDGATEAATAREIGVHRSAVREWLGKRVR